MIRMCFLLQCDSRFLYIFSMRIAVVALQLSLCVVVLVVGVVCIARTHLLRNAHRHVAVCIRECTASSSSYVSCSTARSHLVLVFRGVRACSMPLLQNAHRHITACVRQDTTCSNNCVSRTTTHCHAFVVLRVVLSVTARSLSYHIFSHPLIHFLIDLLSYCLVPVKFESSIRFGCDHDHALY